MEAGHDRIPPRPARIHSLGRSKEAVISRIEQKGPETCSTPVNSNFVLVDIPLHVVGDGPRGKAEYRYRIGTFCGRTVPWSLEEDPENVVRLRIPQEKFRSGEELLLEVTAQGSGLVLWTKSWKAAWQEDGPAVEPTGSGPEAADREADGRPRYHRSGR